METGHAAYNAGHAASPRLSPMLDKCLSPWAMQQSMQRQLQSGHKLAAGAALTHLLCPDHLRCAAPLGRPMPLLSVALQLKPAAPQTAGVPGRAPELMRLLVPPPVLVGALPQSPQWSQALWGGSLLAAAGQHPA